MKVGDIVQNEYDCLGVVVGYWIHEVSEEEHILVHWLKGKYMGDTDAVLESNLEVICEGR